MIRESITIAIICVGLPCHSGGLADVFSSISMIQGGDPVSKSVEASLSEDAVIFWDAGEGGDDESTENKLSLLSKFLHEYDAKSEYLIRLKPHLVSSGFKRFILEQTSVTSIYVSGEGPTWETNISARSKAQVLKSKSKEVFKLLPTVAVVPKASARQIMRSVQDNPAAKKLAKGCITPTTSPCGISTNVEIQVFGILGDGSKTSLGIVQIGLGVGC